MIIKHEATEISGPLTFEPQSFGSVADKEDLRQRLIELVTEQHEIEVTIDQDDLDVAFELLKADGGVEGE